ncbi:hypothetical protein [Flagellimonas iocasae]|uniref:Uncharacterized protein n=1 Tax=Flagellimonas iocasae TaxID=2055905 RepID=A0ABW4XT54_9FLAO
MTQSDVYIVNEDMNEVYELILSSIKNKKNRLSGAIGLDGGLDITPNLPLGILDPQGGHISKVNLTVVNISSDGKLCKMELNRINGPTYKIHANFSLGFTFITIIIIVIYTFSNLNNFQWEILVMPLFGLLYFFAFEGLVATTILNTKERILKILADKKINYKKQ